ncbi:MAG: fibronectin type III domain-containing protein [Ferruginibacter sp.]
MKNFTWLACVLLLSVTISNAQVSYINITNHNTGSGTNNLFNSYVSVSQNCYIDWEVYANGMNSGDACGSKSTSRIVLRRMADSDPASVIASSPIYVNGTCNGKNGNNDKYFANLAPYINKSGRYSVEIQADALPLNGGTSYDNAGTATTWNYMCPPAYYLTGNSGPTGLYYTPTGSCSSFPGKSDPVGGTNVDKLPEVNAALKYFTVGEVDMYRQMAIFNGNFYDLLEGKFQPGNPTIPASLNGITPIPSIGICAGNTIPTLSLGAEMNIFKRTNCSADVTGGRMYYRVYKEGVAAPSYQSFAINFKDNCGVGGPEGNIFPQGGSCNNINNVLDQRWQTLNGVSNILPTVIAPEDAGNWLIEMYMEADSKNCSGGSSIIRSGVNQTGFTVLNPNLPGSTCPNGGVTPLYIINFNATRSNNNILLQWTAPQINTANKYIIERSENGTRFETLGSVNVSAGQTAYQFTDLTYNTLNGRYAYYRIKSISPSNATMYSNIVRIDRNNRDNLQLTVLPNNHSADIRIENISRGQYALSLVSMDGKQLMNKALNISANRISSQTIVANVALTKGMYLAILRDSKGTIIAKRSFIQ